MDKSRLYILQIIGIFMLVMCYVLSDKPDDESLMHFDLSATHVISAGSHGKHNGKDNSTIAPYERTNHKLRLVKHFSFKVILPEPYNITSVLPQEHSVFQLPISEKYEYLYYKEINPPPPKCS